MKTRYLMMLICFMFLVNLSHATDVKKHTLKFNKEDFNFICNAKGQLVINCSNLLAEYDEDTSTPGLPKFIIKLAVPRNMAYKCVDIVSEKALLMENVNIAPNPEIRKTDVTVPIASDEKEKQEKFEDAIYPSNNVEYICSTKVGDYTILNFKVCPFVYDTEAKRLFLLNSISLNIQLREDPTRSKRFEVVGNDFVRTTVVNPEDVSLTPSSVNTIYRNNSDIDYLIITRDSLVDSFMPLINWKKKKGVRAQIISIESIQNHYIQKNVPINIKKYIKECVTNKRLKYVLFGGDNTIVPTRKIWVAASDDEAYMPTDLFFACLNGDLEWDQNRNEEIGEEEDSVDLVPSVYLTRIPVRTSNDVNAIVQKLLLYEATPTTNGWNNNLLMCGVQLDPNTSAEVQSDSLYNQYISAVWGGSRTKFFDTHIESDSIRYDSYCFNEERFQSQLEHGYAFVDVNTHGLEKKWKLMVGEYNCSHAASLQNSQPSIIITTACRTNAFDNSLDPSLSEAFMRNPNNSVVAYLGCSREGWYLDEGIYGSMDYNAMFYMHLFNTEQTNKSYGAIVARAKMEKIPLSITNGCYRWIQFGLNPIGDPEMPVFYNTPIEFTTVSYSETGANSISVSTGGVPDCRICVMSSEDWGTTYYQIADSTDNAIFTGLPDSYSICVTKQGYIPHVLEHRAYIQNETINESMNIVSGNLRIGKSVTTQKPVGNVVFECGTININASSVSLEDGTTIERGTTININGQ